MKPFKRLPLSSPWALAAVLKIAMLHYLIGIHRGLVDLFLLTPLEVGKFVEILLLGKCLGISLGQFSGKSLQFLDILLDVTLETPCCRNPLHQ